ncbi:hypothetical protein Gogos_003518 [Gossypium gossypioides]|uniref:Uncharacterized protein n=1 Tax=Gossypium gossypioides TaxID=34282 RepID=A0A7J9CN46_GOSGO|nr:hypothetical protein [Gossypium gossypioides]
MAIVVIGSSPGLLLCVGVWVGAMAVMTTFFSRVQGGMASTRSVLDMSQIQLALPFP